VNKNNFPDRLKQLRKQNDLSQSQLAEKVNLHYNHIGRYERGQSRPTSDALSRLAEALGVSTDYLIDGTEEEAAKASFNDRELLQQFQGVEQLPEKDKHLVKEFLDAFLTKKKIQSLME
jgi:transcriptional regulator with XRE-family HTH domain